MKCQLVNTVDSANIATPIIGLVTDDLWWKGKVIIRAASEVHGAANVDRVRERIAADGEFTFVLNEPDGLGREIVVRGMVLDMEKDDNVDSYGITDGSAGLRGDVIRTAKQRCDQTLCGLSDKRHCRSFFVRGGRRPRKSGVHE